LTILIVSFESRKSPLRFLQSNLAGVFIPDWLQQFHGWWETEGKNISDAVDRAGTPSLRMFDPSGIRVDEISYPPGYWRML
jgi:acyl-CoA dehydrogenase